MSTYIKRTLEPRIVDELVRIKEIKNKRFCSRRDIMDEINFPNSNPARIVIKSNEKGTGFMRNHYTEEYCKDYIPKKEFDAIVDKCSLIIGNEYSRKRKLDTQDMSIWIQLAMLVALILAFVFCTMAYYIPSYSTGYKIITFIIAAAGYIVALLIMFYNFCTPYQESLTFDQMVFKKVNEYLASVNESMRTRNMEWILIPCHYWMELRFTDKNDADYDQIAAVRNTQHHDESSRIKGSETEQPVNGKYEDHSKEFGDEDE